MGRNKKSEIPICRNCGIVVYEEKHDRNICKECTYNIQKFKQVVQKSSLVISNENNLMREHLIEFVLRIESRNGMASFEEVFLELITLWNHFNLQKNYVNVSADKQISNMWKELKIVYEHIKDYNKFIYYAELFARKKDKEKNKEYNRKYRQALKNKNKIKYEEKL